VHVGKHAEEAAQRRGAGGTAPGGGGEGGADPGFGVAVGGGDLVGGAVTARDQLEHVRFAAVRVRCEFGTQVFLGVIQGVLHQCGVLARQGGAKLVEVLVDGAGGGAGHGEPVSVQRLTKSRVLRQAPSQSASVARPVSVIR